MFSGKDNKQFDWVFKYLKDDTEIKASPYLWTRLHSVLVSTGRHSSLKHSSIVGIFSKWVFSIGLVVTILLGAVVGQQLSASVCSHNRVIQIVDDSGQLNSINFPYDDSQDFILDNLNQ